MNLVNNEMGIKNIVVKMVLYLVVVAFSLSCMITFSGCNSKKVEEEISETSDEKIKIGISFDSFIIERWERERDVFVSTAKSLGAEVNVQNANGDVSEQIAQIEYLIKKKMDVIVIIAIDGESLSSVVKKAKDEGIAIIAYDRLIMNADADMYISFDNEKVGEMMGEALTSSYNIKDVIMICGSRSDNNVSLVEKGFNKTVLKRNINVLDKTYCDGWKAELAYDYINSNVDIVDNVDAIMCGNDDIATNVIRALSVNRKAGKVVVVGQDADLSACQHIVEGTQKMTVYKPVEKLASEAAGYAIKLANKEKIDCELSIDDGTYTIPYIALEPIAVNKDNIDSVIIDGGFHLKEDVYLNVN